MSSHVQTVVIGAGVVGLAIARKLSKFLGHEILILETNSIIGAGTSSRNSEVIHAGIYYAKDSVKAKACVDGKNMLYEDYNLGVLHSNTQYPKYHCNGFGCDARVVKDPTTLLPLGLAVAK